MVLPKICGKGKHKFLGVQVTPDPIPSPKSRKAGRPEPYRLVHRRPPYCIKRGRIFVAQVIYLSREMARRIVRMLNKEGGGG